MKRAQSRHSQENLFALLAPHFPTEPRRLTVLTAVILAMIEGRTVCLYQLVLRVQVREVIEAIPTYLFYLLVRELRRGQPDFKSFLALKKG